MLVEAVNTPEKNASDKQRSKSKVPTDKTTTASTFFLPQRQNAFGMFVPSFMFTSNKPTQTGTLNSQKSETKPSLNNVWGFSSGSDDKKEITELSIQTEFNKDKESRDRIQEMLKKNSTGNNRFGRHNFGIFNTEESSFFNQEKSSSRFDDHFLI